MVLNVQTKRSAKWRKRARFEVDEQHLYSGLSWLVTLETCHKPHAHRLTVYEGNGFSTPLGEQHTTVAQPATCAGWGYAMLAAEADFATLTVANIKAPQDLAVVEAGDRTDC